MNALISIRVSLSCALAGVLLLSGGMWRVESQSAKEHAQPAAKTGTIPPTGMAWIPPGEFWMGSEEPMFPDSRPVHRVRLDGFWIDKTLVTNERFGKFAAATHYVTTAEKKPRIEDFPGADPAKLVAGSLVFTPPDHAVPLDDQYVWWNYVPGANWKRPEGGSSSIKGLEQHPVVQITYEDALAFCGWEGKRLPTEAQFEYAERGGLDRKKYAWGDEFKPSGHAMANTFDGHFPDQNTKADGYATTSPVKSFPANGYGLFDMSGNVWEWTSDWYRPDYYSMLEKKAPVAANPTGPADSYDPAEPGVKKKVQRGGSFLCTDQYCSRYMPGGRGKGEPSTSTNHIGFRCVMPGPAPGPAH